MMVSVNSFSTRIGPQLQIALSFLSQVPWPSGVPRLGRHQHIGYLAEPLQLRRPLSASVAPAPVMAQPVVPPAALTASAPISASEPAASPRDKLTVNAVFHST